MPEPTPQASDHAPEPVSPEPVSPEPVSPARHHLVQAPVKPMDADGVGIAVAGTVIFAVAAVVLWWQRSNWLDESTAFWPWVAVAGTVLGLAGIGYTRWRTRHPSQA